MYIAPTRQDSISSQHLEDIFVLHVMVCVCAGVIVRLDKSLTVVGAETTSDKQSEGGGVDKGHSGSKCSRNLFQGKPDILGGVVTCSAFINRCHLQPIERQAIKLHDA